MKASALESAVLVVEDDHDSAQSFADLLVALGYEATIASNGRTALEVLRVAPGRFCMIMLDLMMPVMDGWTFLIEREQDPELREIPVVVVSAALDAQASASAASVVAVLPKPIDFERLRGILARYGRRGA